MPRSFTEFTESNLGSYRGEWWNKDFLDLMATRWKLDSRRRILDLGSGVGHWAEEILPRAANGAQITLLEVVPDLLTQAEKRMSKHGGCVQFKLGSVYDLPFGDEQFDFVTAQTVFMHLESPSQALKEAIRVLAPGGTIVVCEPNNLLQGQIVSLEQAALPTLDRIKQTESLLAAQNSKKSRGHGDDAIGSLMHRHFVDAGLNEVRTFVSDKVWVDPLCSALYPSFIFMTSGQKPSGASSDDRSVF
jgi:ubiquinone/menaquinone biosynthesis C-methylase UbiE